MVIKSLFFYDLVGDNENGHLFHVITIKKHK